MPSKSVSLPALDVSMFTWCLTQETQYLSQLQLPQQNITEYFVLKNRHLYLIVLEVGSPRSECLVCFDSGRAFYLACIWLPSCYVLSWQRKRERKKEIEMEREKSSEFSVWSCDLIMRTSPLWAQRNLVSSPKLDLQLIFALELGFQHRYLEGTQPFTP